MFTPKVMSFIGYAILAFVIYTVADKYIISPEWYAQADAEASELRARRSAEAFAAAARADGATYVEVQRQARIGYNLSRSLDAPAPVAATAPSRAIAPADGMLVSPSPSRAAVDASDKTAELRACEDKMSAEISLRERAGKVIDGTRALSECARIINLVGKDRMNAVPLAIANATHGTLGHLLNGK